MYPLTWCNTRIKTRPDTRPPVVDGWAGAEMRVFPLFNSDQRTDRQTDGQSLLKSCVSATKKKKMRNEKKKRKEKKDKETNRENKENRKREKRIR